MLRRFHTHIYNFEFTVMYKYALSKDYNRYMYGHMHIVYITIWGTHAILCRIFIIHCSGGVCVNHLKRCKTSTSDFTWSFFIFLLAREKT